MPNSDFLSVFGAASPMLFQQLFSNMAEGGVEPKSKLGKALTSNAGQTGMAMANAALPNKAKDSELGVMARTGVTTGLNVLAPGLGSAMDLLGNAVRSKTRNEDGTYKNKFAMWAENVNPLNAVSNLASGDITGKKLKEQIAKEKKLRLHNMAMQRKMMDTQNNAMALLKKQENFTPAFGRKGMKIQATKGCGCNKKGDGIDTDIFNKFSREEMKKVQEFIGTPATGIYSEKDKNAMKQNALKKGVRLIDYLNSSEPVMVLLKSKT